MIDVAALQSLRAPLLTGLGDEDLQIIARALVREPSPAGTVIVRRGDRSRDLYLLAEGRVHLSRHEHELGTLSPGAYFGEISLIGGRERAGALSLIHI